MSDDKVVDIKSGRQPARVIDPEKFYKISGKALLSLKAYTDYVQFGDHSIDVSQMTLLGYMMKLLGDVNVEKFEEVEDAEAECQS